ncbi:MAG: hypothetical protein M3004_06290 [Bacteroidota bacterium]|nr:hypothetical protein [Bacteroidota bacterium]
MQETIKISVKEYEAMKEELSLLKDNPLLKKMNRLVELLFEEKYGLYLGNDTNDLTESSIIKNWPSQNSAWDNV